jgi:hypothetical protein
MRSDVQSRALVYIRSIIGDLYRRASHLWIPGSPGANNRPMARVPFPAGAAPDRSPAHQMRLGRTEPDPPAGTGIDSHRSRDMTPAENKSEFMGASQSPNRNRPAPTARNYRNSDSAAGGRQYGDPRVCPRRPDPVPARARMSTAGSGPASDVTNGPWNRLRPPRCPPGRGGRSLTDRQRSASAPTARPISMPDHRRVCRSPTGAGGCPAGPCRHTHTLRAACRPERPTHRPCRLPG